VFAVLGVLAIAFLAHSSLAVAFRHGAEFATDARILDGRAEHFRETVDLLAQERGAPVLVDPLLRDALGWPLRDSPAIFDGDAAGASAIVVPADQVPSGFFPLGEPWRLAEGWYPQDIDLLRLWRWLVLRRPYGTLETTDVRIYVPAP
jgi:hypothetical protein